MVEILEILFLVAVAAVPGSTNASRRGTMGWPWIQRRKQKTWVYGTIGSKLLRASRYNIPAGAGAERPAVFRGDRLSDESENIKYINGRG